MKISGRNYRTVWLENSRVKMIDQRKLPEQFEIAEFSTPEQVAKAIREMVVRGAPAIGAAGAYGLALAVQAFEGNDFGELRKQVAKAFDVLFSARPTANDLGFALRQVKKAVEKATTVEEAKRFALQAAEQFAQWNVECCRKIGEHGTKLIKNKTQILTHCNAGALATVDIGTAIAPIMRAFEQGKQIFVYVDETRPRLQGAKLTAFELAEAGIPHAVIVDSAAGSLMQQGKIQLVITGADRIAANGDTANKIGTYALAVLAKENKVPFYVAAPTSTFDPKCKTGKEIPIEERSEEEVLMLQNQRLAPQKSPAKNPAFDVTPAKYIKGFITEKGTIAAKPSAIKKLSGGR